MSARIAFACQVGSLTIEAENGLVVNLDWGDAPDADPGAERALLERARDQVLEYLAGVRRAFDLPLGLGSTPHQQAVWDALRRIPYGSTSTYGDLARAVGSAPRAVGLACGRNPIPIIIPCHRVVGADGSLGGYSAGEGLTTKRRLLAIEGHSLRF